MSVDEQQQPDEICPNCRKAIRKRSKGSFTAWIFQDAICRCAPGATSIADEVVAASSEAPAQSTAQSRKRSLMGESAPVSIPQAPSPTHQPQPALHPVQPTQHAPAQAPVSFAPAATQADAGYAPQLSAGYVPTPPIPHPAQTPLSQTPASQTQCAPQQHTSHGGASPHVVAPSKPSFITMRDLVIASITAVVLYLGLKLTGNEMIVLGLAGTIVVFTLVSLGVRFARK